MPQIQINYGDTTHILNENKTAILLTQDKIMNHNITIDVPSLPTGDIIAVTELPKQADEDKIYFYENGYYKGKNKFIDIIMSMEGDNGEIIPLTYLSAYGGKGFEELIIPMLKTAYPNQEIPSNIVSVGTFEIPSKTDSDNILISNPELIQGNPFGDGTFTILQNLYLYYIYDEKEKIWFKTEAGWQTFFAEEYGGEIYDFTNFRYTTENSHLVYALFNVEWEMLNIPNVISLPQNKVPDNSIYKYNDNYYNSYNSLKDIYFIEKDSNKIKSINEEIVSSGDPDKIQMLFIETGITPPVLLNELYLIIFFTNYDKLGTYLLCYPNNLLFVTYGGNIPFFETAYEIPYLNTIRDKTEITNLETPGYYICYQHKFNKLFKPIMKSFPMAQIIHSNGSYPVKEYESILVNTPLHAVYGKYIITLEAIQNQTMKEGPLYFNFICNGTQYCGMQVFAFETSFIKEDGTSDTIYDGSDVGTWYVPYNLDGTLDIYVNPQAVSSSIYEMLNSTFNSLSSPFTPEEQYYFTIQRKENNDLLTNYFFQNEEITWNDWLTSSNNPGTFFTKTDSNLIFVTIEGIEYQLENVTTETVIGHGKTYYIIATSA